MKEFDLYEPIKSWFQIYLEDKYPKYNIITIDAHSERLDRVLRKYDIIHNLAVGIDIQIDILGLAIDNERNFKLFFIEVKKTNLTLRDLGQLWAYCKLIDPEEAFLITSTSIGSLNKLLNIYNREDLLDYGNGKQIKKMQIAIWNQESNSPLYETMIPKIN